MSPRSLRAVLATATTNALAVWTRPRQAMRHRPASSEARFRSLFEQTNTGIVTASLDGRVISANPAFCDLLGYDQTDLVGMSFESFTHRADRTRRAECIAQLVAGEVPSVRMEARLLHREGGRRWVDASVSLVHDDRSARQVIATVHDITDRKQAERSLERARSLQRVAGELARVGGWAVEVDDGTAVWSQELLAILEHDGGEVVGLDEGLARYVGTDGARLRRAIEACVTDGTPFDLDLEVLSWAGTPLHVRVVAEAVRDDSGRTTRVVGALQDVTSARRAATELASVADQLTTTLESITDAFFTLDRDWRFTYVNRRAEEVLGRPRTALLGRNVWEEFPDAVGSEVYEAYHHAMAEGGGTQVVEDWYYPPLDRWMDVRAYPSPRGVAVYFQDVTEQHEAREALLDRERRLKQKAALLDHAGDAIQVRDVEGRITYWNHSAELLYGWSREEAIGRRAEELLTPDAVTYAAAESVIAARGEWQGELQQRDRNGGEHVVDARWTAVCDGDGALDAVLVIESDITERKRMEEHLLRADRMESIGTLAGGLAHDLNNALTPIQMSAGLLQLEETDEERLRLLDTITASSTRAAHMVRQILTFARGVEGDRMRVDVSALLTEVQGIAEDTFLKSIRIRRLESTALWPVTGDPTQIHQVILNLCINARDAMPDGGTIQLSADAVIVDDEYAALSAGAAPGRYVRIGVEDDGHGMPPQVLRRIFEPFYTTKAQGQGTGLGLSVSSAIVHSHGGFIRADSEVGRGSRILVHLPVAEEVPAAVLEVGPDALPQGRGELVLLVDDEDRVRSALAQTLEAFGYRVIDAADGATAVQLLTDHHDDVDVVLTDMMMPGMDGPATVEALRRIRPDIAIIAASGFSSPATVRQSEEVGVRHYLPKPCGVSQLLETVRRAIDDVGGG